MTRPTTSAGGAGGALIGRYEHLKNRPKSDEAGPLLEKIASQVKPIMTKRDWHVGTLAEFLPSNPALLGLNTNYGQRINLRLRPPGNESSFYEFDQLVLVMLHELTHIVHGPHDASFYKLLAELEEEFYELKRKKYTGDGFHSAGNTLAGVKRNEYAGRLAGLAAAEKRLSNARKVGKGGVLGGGKAVPGKTLREVLAEAAERRIRDDKTCATQHTGGEAEEEVRKAERESEGVDAIDLTGDSDEEQEGKAMENEGGGALVGVKREVPDPASENASRLHPAIASHGFSGQNTARPSPAGPSRATATRSPPARPANTFASSSYASSAAPLRPTSSISKPPGAARSPREEKPTEWSCPTCTLLNPLSRRLCEACDSPRPAGISSDPVVVDDLAGDGSTEEVRGVMGKGAGIGIQEGWFCGVCGAGPREWEMWSCALCGTVRGFG